ncbi:hypothetical protein LCGC14_2364640 [marine sediment metagenome]|uniref:Uncharacterized protein n=1 Tax=marine sediment metagenome TaxID=412755 RepID=A0A0F9F0B6_9ZZZZ
MIKENVSQLLKPIAEKAKSLTEVSQFDIQLLEISAMIELKMDTTHGTDGKLFIKIYPDQTIEIRHRTNDATYYYYPLNPDHTDPRQCKPKGRSYMFTPNKYYKSKKRR